MCDYYQFWYLAGRVAQSAEAMPNFSFCYVTSRKNQLFSAPILYRSIIIKLYNNTTIFSSLLPICVCFRGGAYSAPQTPSWERLCIPKKVSLIFFFPNDMPDVVCTLRPAFQEQRVPVEICRLAAIFDDGHVVLIDAVPPEALHELCLETQYSTVHHTVCIHISAHSL